MTTDITKIDPKEFGLQETEVKTIEAAFMPKIVERDGLAAVYTGLLTREISPALCEEAGSVRKKLVKVRTGIADIHKTQKAFYLAAGRYVDAWKNKETLPITQMEEVLAGIEEHYQRIEAAKIAELQTTRSAEIQNYSQEGAFVPGNLGELAEEVYGNYLLGVKTAYDQRIAAEKAAKEAEEKRINDERVEQERIRRENEKLKADAEKTAKAAELERKKQADILAKLQAKVEAERKEREEKERKEHEAHEAELAALRKEQERAQAELNAKAEAERKQQANAIAQAEAELAKGDADKVLDLVRDLKALKTKYNFKSKKSQKMYADTGLLLDKIVNFIGA
jgi:hypothetical protein